MDGPQSPCYFQVLQSFYQSFSDCTKSTNHNWYNRHFLILLFFSIPLQSRGTYPSFDFFQFYYAFGRDTKVHNSASSFFFLFSLFIIRFNRLAAIWQFFCLSQPQKSFCVLFSRTEAVFCKYHLFVWSNFNFIIIIIIFYYYYTPCRFFPLALTGGLSLESEWQHVSSSQ